MKKILLILLFVFISSNLDAGYFDYRRDWRTIQTAHFNIHYHDGLEKLAQKTARFSEEIHDELSPIYKWQPWGRTEIVLVDSTDESNGMATPIPYNWILLYAVPPRVGTFLSYYDDWLKELIAHEYTHILDIDPARGFWKPFRLFFGKMVSPGGMSPKWMKEGLAVFDETILTSSGRGRSKLTDMVIRTAILEDNFPKLDQADGFGWRWPSYLVPYLFGGKFTEYIVEQYGLDKYIELNISLQKSPLLSMVNHQAKRIYGKTFFQLWKEWQENLKNQYNTLKLSVEKNPLTNYNNIRKDDNAILSAMSISPDGSKLVYHKNGVNKAPALFLYDLNTGKEKRLAKAVSVTQTSFSPDGKKIVYSALATSKTYYRYYDLFVYDIEKKKVKRITTGARARSPDYNPKNNLVIYVEGSPNGDELKTYDLENKKEETLFATANGIRFDNPRWSPDGTKFTFVRWENGFRVVVCDTENKKCLRVTKDNSEEFYPSWTKDGKNILMSSAKDGIYNIYKCALQKNRCERITNTLTGLFIPIQKSENEIFAQRYYSKGFDIVSMNIDVSGDLKSSNKILREELSENKVYSKAKKEIDDISKEYWEKLGKSCKIYESKKIKFNKFGPIPKDRLDCKTLNESVFEKENYLDKNLDYPSKKYSPFGKSLFLPRYFIPSLAYTGEGIFATMNTGGVDPLRRHSWSAGGTYRSDANFFGYFGTYAYTRWPVNFGIGGVDYVTKLGRITFDKDGNMSTLNDRRTVEYYEERRRGFAFISYPYSKHLFRLMYYYEDRLPDVYLTRAEEDLLNTGIFAGVMATYSFTNTKSYPASISSESGQDINIITMISDAKLGANEKNEQSLVVGEVRQFIPLWAHHVLALRGKTGIAWGDTLVQGTFSVGGALGEEFLSGGTAYNYFPLRGLPLGTYARERALLFSGEYRFPLVSPQRGFGTTPLFLNSMHMALFADFGDAWNRGAQGKGSFDTFFDDFFLGVGGELRADFVIGHGLPMTTRLGYAIIVRNRDRLGNLKDPITGENVKNGIIVLQFGTAF